jgi:hypothetical protein
LPVERPQRHGGLFDRDGLAFVSSHGLSSSTVAVVSTTNFQGTARFFNVPLFGGPMWDYFVKGGDLGFELMHMLEHAFNGSSASGGRLHLINNGACPQRPPETVDTGPQLRVNSQPLQTLPLHK